MPAGKGKSTAGSAGALPREFLAAILDAVAHPIFVKDREFRFVLLNRALCEMVGRTCEEMIGKTDYDFFSEEESDFFRQKDIALFASGEPLVIDEEPITDAEGRRHILTTTKVPLRDAGGQVTHLVGIIHDITRLKEIEEELRKANERLESRVRVRTEELVQAQQRLLRQERLAVLGQLAGGLAHQIRNPLGAITNASFVLRRALRAHADPDVQRSIEIILEEATQANRIVTDLVDFARVRAPDRQPASLEELVGRVVREMKIPVSIRIELDFPPLPLVAIDVHQVQDAVENLVHNAIEAMPQGGTIRVGARRDEGWVVLHVQDSGPGVLAQIRDRLFEPLVTTKPQGMGLGLATARYLVEHQGGELVHAPTEGGARFEIRLPAD
jgi:PAS domain S-box-containing protein